MSGNACHVGADGDDPLPMLFIDFGPHGHGTRPSSPIFAHVFLIFSYLGASEICPTLVYLGRVGSHDCVA